jgi:glycosyltransferase involved in cell wall biosynthesis
MNGEQLSIVIPAKNEAKGLSLLLPELASLYPEAEIIVVDDASTDGTESVALDVGGAVSVVSHLYSKGNGAAIKSGLRKASRDIIVCMDADGQHQPKEIALLLAKLNEGYDMVVGSRSRSGQAGAHRSFANGFYNRFATWMVGHKVEDLTSGFRAVRREKFLEFISLLPNKFSYPTTITMSFFRAGYSVGYVAVDVQKRIQGTKSHVNLWKDGVRFLLIIFKIGTLFSPLKLFFPISLGFFSLGIGYYAFTFFTENRFTNMSALLISTSVIIFLMGLVSEQITNLLHQGISK